MKSTLLVFLFILHLWTIFSKKQYIIEVADNKDLAAGSRSGESHGGEGEEAMKEDSDEDSEEDSEEGTEGDSEEEGKEEVADEEDMKEVLEEGEGVVGRERAGGEDYWYWRRRGASSHG